MAYWQRLSIGVIEWPFRSAPEGDTSVAEPRGGFRKKIEGSRTPAFVAFELPARTQPKHEFPGGSPPLFNGNGSKGYQRVQRLQLAGRLGEVELTDIFGDLRGFPYPARLFSMSDLIG